MEQTEQAAAAREGQTALEMAGADFSWEPAGPRTLHSLSFRLERGQLMIIVGEVGAGKSSILAALMGEMYLRAGSSSLAGAPYA